MPAMAETRNLLKKVKRGERTSGSATKPGEAVEIFESAEAL